MKWKVMGTYHNLDSARSITSHNPPPPPSRKTGATAAMETLLPLSFPLSSLLGNVKRFLYRLSIKILVQILEFTPNLHCGCALTLLTAVTFLTPQLNGLALMSNVHFVFCGGCNQYESLLINIELWQAAMKVCDRLHKLQKAEGEVQRVGLHVTFADAEMQ